MLQSNGNKLLNEKLQKIINNKQMSIELYLCLPFNQIVFTHTLSLALLSHFYVSLSLSFSFNLILFLQLCIIFFLRWFVAFCRERGHQLAGTTRPPWLTFPHLSPEISKMFMLKPCHIKIKIYLFLKIYLGMWAVNDLRLPLMPPLCVQEIQYMFIP